MYLSKSSNAYALQTTHAVQRTHALETAQRRIRHQEEELQRRRELKRRKMARRRRNFYLVVNLAVVFAVCTSILFGYAQITKLSRENANLTKDYEDLVAKNKKLDVEIQAMQDINVIEDIAINKLGMSKPEKYQTVYLDLGRSDQGGVTTAQQEESAEEQKGLLSALSDGFYNVLEYFN